MRRPRAQSATLLGKATVQNGLSSAARDSECAILPIQEIAAYPCCSACDHLSSGERLTARWALPAVETLVPWYRSANTADSLSSGHTDSTSESDTVQWEWDLDMAGGYCPSVPEPPLPLQPSLPFQSRFLLQELIRARTSTRTSALAKNAIGELCHLISANTPWGFSK